MKLSSLTLAAAVLAVAGTAAFAQDATVTRSVRVGPNGEVTHVTRRVSDNGTRVVRRTRVRHVVTTPVIVHRRVVYHHPMWYHHHHEVVYVHHHDWRHNHVAYRD